MADVNPASVNPASVNPPSVNPATLNLASLNLARVAKALEGPAYVAVGFGVLGFQRGQVYRRALQRRVGRLAGAAGQSFSALTEEFVERLPEDARDLVKGAGDLATELPREAGDILKEAAAVCRFGLRVLQAPANRRT
jgi:hypothetical protein